MIQAAIGGVIFAALVYTYFYLWTAAAALLACLGILWFVGRRKDRRRILTVFGIVAVIGLLSMVPYFLMLARRVSTVDSAQALVLTRDPDLFRLCEIASLVVLVSLIVGSLRRRFEWNEPVVLFTASLAVSVLAVFNQQIITGFNQANYFVQPARAK